MNDLQKPHVSVIDPITTAIERVKLILFNPFEIEKWFIIGFCAWLANLTEVIANLCNVIANLRDELAKSGEFVRHHLQVIIIVAVVILVIGFAIGIVLTWLSSRGRFMFLHCVAENKTEVKVPWRKYRRQGNSLFLFRLALTFISLLCFGLVFGGGIVLSIAFGRGGHMGLVIVVLAVLILLFIPLAIIFTVIDKLTKYFVVPIMYLRQCACMEAWREYITLFSANILRFIGFILFRWLLAIVTGTIQFIVFLGCCCCGGCLLAIPYIGTVLWLPILVFERSYSLYYLGQYGPEFDVFDKAQYEPAPDEFGPAAVQ